MLAALSPILLVACTESAVSVAVSPSAPSASGYEPLEITLTGVEPSQIESALIGGVEAYDLPEAPSESFDLMWQGAPTPGENELSLGMDGETVAYPAAVTIAEPIDPVFDRMVGIGASFTMGVQNGVPSDHGAIASPGMLIARQAGAFYSLPLLVPGLFPEIGVGDIGPAPACEIPDIPDFVAKASADVISTLSDENGFTYAPGRETPDLMPRNLAVGGMRVGVLADGTDAFELNFLAHLVYDPYGEMGAPPPTTQLQAAIDFDPTLVVSFDLLGNDLIWSVVTEHYLDPSVATPPEDLRAPLEKIFAGLAATGAELFISNMPDPTALGVARQKRALMVSEGAYDEAGAEAVAQEIRDMATQYNEVLAETAAPYPNVHIVDVAAVFAEIAANGVAVGDETLKISLVGGFISTDGLHFSNTGYGLLADTFIQAINDRLGLSVPRMDLAEIYAADPNNLATLSASVDLGQCAL